MGVNKSKPHLGIKELAKYLNVHYNTAYKLVTKGEIKGSKVGNTWRIRPEDAETYLTDRRQPPLEKPTDLTQNILAFVNQKGGVGKSTLTINLAESFSKMSYNVLIIDIDPQGNSTTGVGVKTKNLHATITEILLEGFPVEESVQKTAFGFDIIPADIGLSEAEIELLSKMNRDLVLKDALNKASDFLSKYDFILIDCPPSLGILTLNALSTAHYCIVPMDIGIFAFDGTKLLLKTIAEIRQLLNKSLQVAMFVITQADQRTNLTKDFSENLRQNISYPVAQTEILWRTAIKEAQFQGVPIGKHDTKCATMFDSLAKEIIEEVNKDGDKKET